MESPGAKSESRAHHLDIAEGDVGRYVLLPGDPGRCEVIASRLDSARRVASKREFETWTGALDGTPVSVTSTGIGGPSAAIALEELAMFGADTFIQIGKSDSMQTYIEPGDLGIASGAIRDEGTSLHYLPIEFPAVADVDVTLALRTAANRTNRSVHVGVVQSMDSFYGHHEPDRMPVGSRLKEQWRAWIAGGAICSEMEAATLFIVAATLGVRAGGIMLIAGHPDRCEMTAAEQARCALGPLMDTAVAGVRELIALDGIVDE